MIGEPTHAKIASVQTATEMPGVEEIARAIYTAAIKDPSGHVFSRSNEGMTCVEVDGPIDLTDAARAILALFAPILAEKERLEREWAYEKERADMAVGQMIRQNDRISYWQDVAEAAGGKILAAEAALAAERKKGA